MKIDFLASWPHYIDHMAPIYHSLGKDAGFFYVAPRLADHAAKRGINPFLLAGQELYEKALRHMDPIVTAAYSDIQSVYLNNTKRPIVLMEHGIGIVYPGNASYAGNVGYRKRATLTMAPNEKVYELTKKAIPEMQQAVIGTPKLDRWARRIEEEKIMPIKPTVAISFHWDGRHVAPEAGTALGYFSSEIPKLAKQKDFTLIGHAHPRWAEYMKEFYNKHNIEFVEDFEDIMKRAQLYVCDNSSTIYEFLATGWPVLFMNSPAYRRDVNFGIRFWDYTDIGYQVNKPEELFGYILKSLAEPQFHALQRAKALYILFPYLGTSARQAAKVLRERFDLEGVQKDA